MVSNKPDDFKSLNVLAFALMSGLLLFVVTVVYLSYPSPQAGPGVIISPTMDLLLVACIGLMSITLSRVVSSNFLENFPLEKRADYQTALGCYRSGILLRLALLEFAGFLASAFALITGNLSLLMVAGLMLVMMWLGRPSEAEFAQWRG